MGSAGAVALAALAILVVGHRGSRSVSAAPIPAGAQALVAELGVLRRPQTATDRALNSNPLLRAFLRAGPGRPTPVPGLTRLATVLPDGSKLFLYVVAPPAERAEGGYELGHAWVTRNRDAVSGAGQTASDLRTPFRPTGVGWPLNHGSNTTVYFEVVPDGVARVRWVFPRRAAGVPRIARGRGRTHVYPRPLTVYVTVHNNVAVDRLPPRGLASTDTWYTPSDRVIKTHTSTKSP